MPVQPSSTVPVHVPREDLANDRLVSDVTGHCKKWPYVPVVQYCLETSQYIILLHIIITAIILYDKASRSALKLDSQWQPGCSLVSLAQKLIFCSLIAGGSL